MSADAPATPNTAQSTGQPETAEELIQEQLQLLLGSLQGLCTEATTSLVASLEHGAAAVADEHARVHAENERLRAQVDRLRSKLQAFFGGLPDGFATTHDGDRE